MTSHFEILIDEVVRLTNAVRAIHALLERQVSGVIETQRADPIGIDALGFPIFAQAQDPAEEQLPSAQTCDAAPQQTPHPFRPE